MKKLLPILLASSLLVGCGSKSDEVILVDHELGKPITLESILDEDADDAKIIECDEVLERYLDVDDDDQILPIGIYKITIKNHHKKQDYKVKVKDSKKPKWKLFTDEVVSQQGKKIYNWDVYFKAEDLSNAVFIEVDDADVDYDKEGTYTIEVVAKDSSDNQIKKTSQVKITKDEKEVKENEVKDDSKFTSDVITKEDDVIKNEVPKDTPVVDPSEGFTSIDQAHAYAKQAMQEKISGGWKGAQYSISQHTKNGTTYYTVNIFEVKPEDKKEEE